MSDRPRWWRRVLGRLVADEDDDFTDIDPDPVPDGPADIASARLRRLVDARGEITAVALVDQPHGPWFEAELSDGTGQVTLCWMGRTVVPGVVVGVRMRVRGRLAPDRGRQVIFNPDYNLEPARPVV
ncbi:MAG: DNA-binding protein [Propionibacteriaceae bacterium]|nr:DNA-binding protein [Propionibacteriaceae bacterium]